MRPGSEGELAEAVADAAAAGRPLEIRGGGTRLGLGRPVQAEATLDVSGLSGITLYEPGALTLVVQAGTPLAEVEAALEAEGQMLPFEPMDHRALLGTEGAPTIGGVVAAAISGPRRLQAGACRDAMLGVRFVDGEGAVVQNGGRVMKNVTGYDLVKLMCGSWGTLGVLTEISFKVLPRPSRAMTLTIDGLDEAQSVEAMTAATKTPFDVSGAARTADGRTAVRVEGMEDQAGYRADRLSEMLGRFGEVAWVEGAAHDALWREVRDCAAFAGTEGAVWRLSLAPTHAPRAVAAIREAREAQALYDWAGGLVWLKTPEQDDAGATLIRRAVAVAVAEAGGGHATLVRASPTTRASVDVFEPEPATLARLSQGLRERFDPAGILNPGRMSA